LLVNGKASPEITTTELSARMSAITEYEISLIKKMIEINNLKWQIAVEEYSQ